MINIRGSIIHIEILTVPLDTKGIIRHDWGLGWFLRGLGLVSTFLCVIYFFVVSWMSGQEDLKFMFLAIPLSPECWVYFICICLLCTRGSKRIPMVLLMFWELINYSDVQVLVWSAFAKDGSLLKWSLQRDMDCLCEGSTFALAHRLSESLA